MSWQPNDAFVRAVGDEQALALTLTLAPTVNPNLNPNPNPNSNPNPDPDPDLDLTPSFAVQNPTFDGVCQGNRKTCKCGQPFFS